MLVLSNLGYPAVGPAIACLTGRFAPHAIGHRSSVTSKTHDASEGRRVPGEEIEQREPDSPTELDKPSIKYVLRKTAREFSKDQCTDLAAALTYYAVLAMFPAAIALLSLVGLVGQGPQTVKTLMGILDQMGAGSATKTLGPTLTSLANAPQAAGFAFVIGLLTALWSASGYVGSFGRAMNRIYEIREGRPIWKLRPLMLLITLVSLILAALVAMALVLTGPAAKAVGDAIGLGSTAVLVWDIVKWPVILAVVIFIVAVFYYATPNVKQPKFRWISVGAIFAILGWIVASAAFGFYVSRFGSYNKTYGTLAGAVVLLLWLWITNLALLFGAELDAELERGRELQAGLPAEKTVHLPPRDTKNIEKQEQKEAEDVERGRQLREAHAEDSTEVRDAEATSRRCPLWGQAEGPRRPVAGPPSGTLPDMTRDVPTVVVVDDPAEVRMLVKTRWRLSGQALIVGEGANGRDAIALAAEHRPELMLLDVSMPVMDGLEALPRLREASPETRVVLYSGFDEEGLTHKAAELGAAAFIEKSTSVDSLVDELLLAVDRGPALDGPSEREAQTAEPVDPPADQRVLDEHLERFREVFEEAAIGMATMTLSGQLVRANRALATLVGRTRESLVGLPYADLIAERTTRPDADLDQALESVHRRGADVVQVEHDLPGSDGHRRVLAT